MGCCGGVASDPNEPFEQKIRFQLAVVKQSLAAQLSDPVMMQEVLKGIVLFLNDTVQQSKDPPFLKFFGYSMLGLQLAQKGLNLKKYPPQVQGGLFNLTNPVTLRYADLDHNFLEVKRVFKEVRAYQDKPKEEGGSGGANLSAFSSPGRQPVAPAAGGGANLSAFSSPGRQPVAPAAGSQEDAPAEEPEDEMDASYVAVKKKMTELLEPLCDVVDGLLANVDLKKRFCKSAGVDERNYLEQMKTTLGVVLATVKVFEPAKVQEGMKLCAFVGPESYGKSSLINYICSGGTSGDDFMPASEGMGTQVVCKIANKAPESLQLASNPRPTSGNVQAMVMETIKAQKAKMDRGEGMGSKDMDMIRAQKPFDTQGQKVEFLDVPGIKTSTAFHSELALSMCTSLVLVCGKPETLEMQLTSGDLALLVDIVARIQPPIPIQCVSSFHVEMSDYTERAEQEYKRIANKFFKNSKKISFRWMNFYADGLEGPRKKEMVQTFLKDTESGGEKVMDPIRRFLDVESTVNELTLKLSKFFAKELEPYFKQWEENEGPFFDTKDGIVAMGKNMDEANRLVKDNLDVGTLQEALGEVALKAALPEFFVSIGNKTMKDVPGLVLVIQDLWNEVRLAEIQWLTGAAGGLHEGVFLEKMFNPLAQDNEDQGFRSYFTTRVAETFRLYGAEEKVGQGKGKLEKNKMGYWLENCSSNIAPYLDPNNFTWFLAGFYLISTDDKNKHLFMNPFRRDQADPRKEQWRAKVMEEVETIPYPEWVKKCKDEKADLFNCICNCAKLGCDKVRDVANNLRVMTDPNCYAMEQLVEISFVLLERLFIRMKSGYDDQCYTDFGRYIKKNIGGVSELKDVKDKLDSTSDAELGTMFDKALKEMGKTSNSAVSATWRSRMDEEMPGIIQKTKVFGDMLSSPFSGHSEQAILLLPSETRKYTKDTSFPHSARLLKAGVENSSTCVNAQAPEGQDKAFPAFCLKEMCGAGHHVAVYFRRGDTASYDPLPAERDMLRELRRQPRITKIFVLWTPPSAKEWNVGKYTKEWNLHEGLEQSLLGVELVPLAEGTDGDGFYAETVLTACQGAAAQAEQNLAKVKDEMQKLKKKFTGYVDDYYDELSRSKSSTPKTLHDLMKHGGEARVELDKLRKSGKGVKPKQPKFDIPEPDFLKANFMGTATDKLVAADEREGGDALQSLDELKMRSFLYTVMIGQTLKFARAMAAQVFKKIFLPVLDYVASKQFFASAEQILEALRNFNALPEQVKQRKDEEPQALYLLRLQELFTQESFEHCYAGFVTYKLMPVMYVAVLAKLHEAKDFRVTAEYHRAHYLRAMSMLGDKEDPMFRVKHAAEKAAAVIAKKGAHDDVM